MYIVFRPGDGKRLATGLGLAIKEAEKGLKAINGLGLPSPTQVVETRAEMQTAEIEVQQWLTEHGDAPKVADIESSRRVALHIAAYRYNVDTEKIRDRKEKQGRDTSSEDEEIRRTGWLIDRLLDRSITEQARKLLADDYATVTIDGRQFSGPKDAESLVFALERMSDELLATAVGGDA